MKRIAILLLGFILSTAHAQIETKIETHGHLKSFNPEVTILKTNHTILDIKIYGTSSKQIWYKNNLVREWDEFIPEQLEAPLHKKTFNAQSFFEATGFSENEIVYLDYIYYRQGNSLLPAIHIQVFKERINSTLILEQDSYDILLSRQEIDFCQPINARDQMQLLPESPIAYFQWWSKDSPAPGNPHPTGSPNEWQAENVEPSFLENKTSVASPEGWLLNSLPLRTQGNNVLGITYGVNNGKVSDGFVLANGDTFAPDYDLNSASNQGTTLQSSLVNMFVYANLLHDWYWLNGFRENNGNFQENNFNRGGEDGDPMTVAAWYSPVLINNAFYSGTHIDGTPGSVNMLPFLYDEINGIDRHSGFDSQIFSHEYQHGVTRRLVGEISFRAAIALNEGWSDVAALIYTTKEVPDMKTSTFAIGGWTLFQFLANENYRNNYYYGGRILPITYDMNRNPITLADIDTLQFEIEDGIDWNEGAYNPQSPHFIGQVWVSALWDVYTLLNEVYPYDEARSIMTMLLIEGLKLTPPEPVFLEARDAFVLADEFISNGEHRVAIWNAFARRGMGTGAVAPWDLTDIVEDFSEPNWADFNQDNYIDLNDLTSFLYDFDIENRRADINWDGELNEIDIQLFIDMYMQK